METQEQGQFGINAQETNKSNYGEELIKREEIKDTPFQMVKHGDMGWILVLGQYRLTEPTEKKETLLKLVNGKTNWKFVMTVISVVCEQTLQVMGNELNEKIKQLNKEQNGAN